MTPDLAIKTALATALSGITYNSVGVPFYDMGRDDMLNPNIHLSYLNCDYIGNKSKTLWEVDLTINVNLVFDSTYQSRKPADEVGALMETALNSALSISGFDNVIQYLKRSNTAESTTRKTTEVIKIFSYHLTLQEQ